MNRYGWKRTGRFYCYMVTRHDLPSVNIATSQRKWLKHLKPSQDCPIASGVSGDKHSSILCFTSCQEQFKIKELCGWPVRSGAVGTTAFIFPFYPITNILGDVKQIPSLLYIPFLKSRYMHQVSILDISYRSPMILFPEQKEFLKDRYKK